MYFVTFFKCVVGQEDEQLSMESAMRKLQARSGKLIGSTFLAQVSVYIYLINKHKCYSSVTSFLSNCCLCLRCKGR